MNKFKNMKIAIKDDVYLKDVCGALKKIGYRPPNLNGSVIYTSDLGNTFTCDGNWALDIQGIYEPTTLDDLLRTMSDAENEQQAKTSD